jgi:hypothetical protein
MDKFTSKENIIMMYNLIHEKYNIDNSFINEIKIHIIEIYDNKKYSNLNLTDLNNLLYNRCLSNLKREKLIGHVKDEVKNITVNTDLSYNQHQINEQTINNKLLDAIDALTLTVSDLQYKISNLQTSNSLNALSENQTEDYFIHLDSRNRDVAQYRDANYYKISFTTSATSTRGVIYNMPSLHSITSIELLDGNIPNFARYAGNNYIEPYLMLNIEEFRGDMYSTVNTGIDIFGKIYFDNSIHPDATYLNLIPNGSIKDFLSNKKTALTTLNGMTIKFLNYDGSLFDFSSYAPQISGVSTTGTPTTITTSISHNLQTGDRIYLQYFSTSNNDVFANRTEGHIATVTGATTFTIPVNITSVTTPSGYVIAAKYQNNLTFKVRAMTQ